jgi:hypothetical protein
MGRMTIWTWFVAGGASIGILSRHLFDSLTSSDSLADAAGSLPMAWFVAPLSTARSPLKGVLVVLAALRAVFLVCLVRAVQP